MDFSVGVGSHAVHYGLTNDKTSVDCRYSQFYTKNLSWTDDKERVTCLTCRMKLDPANKDRYGRPMLNICVWCRSEETHFSWCCLNLSQ